MKWVAVQYLLAQHVEVIWIRPGGGIFNQENLKKSIKATSFISFIFLNHTKLLWIREIKMTKITETIFNFKKRISYVLLLFIYLSFYLLI